MTAARNTWLALAGAITLAGSAHAFPGGDPAAFKAAATAAFTEADADGSAGLTAQEFASFHQILRAKLEALRFAALDTNGDGVLTQAELEAGRPQGRGGRRHGPGF
jgi:hypothetical protein